MARFNKYIALVKPWCRDAATLATIHAVLAAIQSVTILAYDSLAFEFSGTRATFKTAREKLAPWCLVQRERFEYEEGGG